MTSSDSERISSDITFLEKYVLRSFFAAMAVFAAIWTLYSPAEAAPVFCFLLIWVIGLTIASHGSMVVELSEDHLHVFRYRSPVTVQLAEVQSVQAVPCLVKYWRHDRILVTLRRPTALGQQFYFIPKNSAVEQRLRDGVARAHAKAERPAASEPAE